jgi:peptidoglycan/xylan/chitin deacetylase (PgdA/CDA1 family)
MSFIVGSLIVALSVYILLKNSILLPNIKGLPILMYHKISNEKSDDLTMLLADLEEQFNYFSENGYQSLSFTDLKNLCDNPKEWPKKSVILTFDDGYVNNQIFLLPLLEKYKLKATIFLPLQHLGKVNVWDEGNEPLMNIETVKQIESLPSIELGIHTFLHQNYKYLSIAQIKEDLCLCDNFLKEHQINVVKVLAYPYGGTHRKNPELNLQMKELLKKHGYWYALRIGNRINKIPLNDIYELFRIDVRGTDTFREFKIKIKKGRTRFFR